MLFLDCPATLRISPSHSLQACHIFPCGQFSSNPMVFYPGFKFWSNIFTPETALVPHSQLLAWCLKPILFSSVKYVAMLYFITFIIYLCLIHTSPLVYSANFTCILVVFSTKTSAQLTMPLENYTRITM